MKVQSVAIIAISILLNGCASGYIDEAPLLEKSDVCCKTLSALPFTDIARDKAIRVQMSAASPAFNFDEGKSYFLALKLPPHIPGESLALHSFLHNTTPMIYTAHVFLPHVTFLDTSFKPVRSVSLDLEEQRGGLFKKTSWVGAVPLSPSYAYAVIHTGKDERIKTVQMRDSDAGAVFVPIPAAGVARVGGARYRTIPPSPTGELKVELVSLN